MIDPDAETLPMFKAAPVVIPEENYVEIVYCSRCGNSYLNNCPNPNHKEYIERQTK